MIVNEIAKFEKRAPAAVEVLLVAHLGELALVLILELLRPIVIALSPRLRADTSAIKGVPARPMDDATLYPERGRKSRAR